MRKTEPSLRGRGDLLHMNIDISQLQMLSVKEAKFQFAMIPFHPILEKVWRGWLCEGGGGGGGVVISY